MSVLKVIEILANSNKGWEDAAKNAVAHASKTVKNIKSVYIKEQSATVTNGEISQYRVNAKITFEIQD
ncbi:dodecin domain-containing protein [Cyclobacteriaceae bacterium YHN15]|jgi:flavin-binding protein dodecin|nr:dodecin domain-containing protein [Cyclobacteriaceae bacterium YHN15]